MGGMAAQQAHEQVNPTPPPDGPGAAARRCVHIGVDGVVQGVGFRPFVFRLASELGLTGWVRNTSSNVGIVVCGEPGAVETFVRRLTSEAPPLARIQHMTVEDAAWPGSSGFEIRESTVEEGRSQLVSPDVATCPACLAEILDPDNRRHRYAFTNCTNCGPRFTIITAMPYDRPNTTMASFTMCPECQAEYIDPANRRFHAQPNACPVCGPALTLLDSNGHEVPCTEPIARVAALLGEGRIVAIKGLGGFLLACDATSPEVVQRLRERKRRPSKPFAVMVRDLDTARTHCVLTPEEETLLLSTAAPIVLVPWRTESPVCTEVAPGLSYLGIMLPYTPLHHLLLRQYPRPLIMTSGNLSEEPIAAQLEEALVRLHGVADYFLTHNRPIHSRYDDSVVMVAGGVTHTLRRARGYAPYPVDLTHDSLPTLALGSHTKNTFCLTGGRRAFVSQHVGDLDSVETLEHLEHTVDLYRRLFGIEPDVVAHDLHPDYASTSLARRLATSPRQLRAVQHHHAHIVSCMVENHVSEPVIGVAFDGSGLGSDGTIWGGEFLLCNAADSRRAGHLECLPLPGGDAATLRPYRTAAAYVMRMFGEGRLEECAHLSPFLSDEERRILARQVEVRLNTPLTSSMGRLFDAVAAIAGIRGVIDYDGQAAIELEMQAHRLSQPWPGSRYGFNVEHNNDTHVVRVAPVLDGVIRDAAAGVAVPLIAAAFHEAVMTMTVRMCTMLSQETGIKTVALSGGVFQNRLLVAMLPARLREAGFRVLLHRYLPANDGCVSLGQAIIAATAAERGQ
jgi:hydrogenase maturation protein HypF